MGALGIAVERPCLDPLSCMGVAGEQVLVQSIRPAIIF
jgi:hypothetical protein